MLVQDFLECSAIRLPHKVALVCQDRRLTYAEIDAMANRLANALRNRGVKRGDRVVLYLENSLECVVGVFASLKLGGVVVPINKTSRADRLRFVLNNCRATALLASGTDAVGISREAIFAATPSLQVVVVCGRVREALSDSGDERWVNFGWIQEHESQARPPRVGIDLDLACLIYTSGTTGDPKGVMCGHDNVVFATDAVIEYLENRQDDVVLNVLPLSFSYGLYQVFMTFRFGGTLVLREGFAFPAVVMENLARERVTGFPAVPTIFSSLLKLDLSRYDLSSLRYLTNAAAALTAGQIEEIGRRFPGVKFYSMYGMTELKRALYLPPDQVRHRPDSVGIPIPGTEAWLEGADGCRVGAGEVGELVVRGRHVMRGYWEDPRASAERFRPGILPGERVCRTGDLFRTDAEGYFYFVSRKDDIIKCRGEKVAPRKVEQVISELEGVAEVAVIGVADAILGQAVKAFVIVDGVELTPTRILAHCRERLEEHMVPKYVEFCTAFPKTASGKVRKAELV